MRHLTLIPLALIFACQGGGKGTGEDTRIPTDPNGGAATGTTTGGTTGATTGATTGTTTGATTGATTGTTTGTTTGAATGSTTPGASCGPVILDPTWAYDGTATVAAPGTDYDDGAYAAHVQSDGMVLAGGRYYRDPIGRTANIARFDSTGALDAGFGGGDGFADNLWQVDSAVHGLAQQTDDKIVASGHHQGELMVMRLETDGSWDPTFNGTGWAAHPSIQVHYNTRAHLALQADGKILVAGHEGGDFKLVRFLTDGTPDTVFGTNGVATADLGGADEAYTLLLQADGKAVLAGRSDTDFGVARFDSTGALDAGFGTGGMTTVDILNTDEAYGLAQAPNGDLVVVGCSDCTFGFTDDTGWGIARLLPDGTPDPAFGTGGTVYDRIPTNLVGGTGMNDKAYAAHVFQTGEILVAGQNQWNDGAGRMLLARYLADGTLDVCFDSDGYYVQQNWDQFGQSDAAHAIDVQADGKLIITGTVNPSAWGYKGLLRMSP